MTSEELSDEDRYAAAAQDLNILAGLMVAGAVSFAVVNMIVGTFGWIAAALSLLSTLTWATGLWQRSSPIAAFVKMGYGFGGLAAPIVGLIGLGFAIAGYRWGWAVVAGAILYLGFSVLGLTIIERAEQAGVLETFTERLD